MLAPDGLAIGLRLSCSTDWSKYHAGWNTCSAIKLLISLLLVAGYGAPAAGIAQLTTNAT